MFFWNPKPKPEDFLAAVAWDNSGDAKGVKIAAKAIDHFKPGKRSLSKDRGIPKLKQFVKRGLDPIVRNDDGGPAQCWSSPTERLVAVRANVVRLSKLLMEFRSLTTETKIEASRKYFQRGTKEERVSRLAAALVAAGEELLSFASDELNLSGKEKADGHVVPKSCYKK